MSNDFDDEGMLFGMVVDPFESFDKQIGAISPKDLLDIDFAISKRIAKLTNTPLPSKTNPVDPQEEEVEAPEDTASTPSLSSSPSPEAYPKTLKGEDLDLYKALPYYGLGDTELDIYTKWKGRPPSLKEYDALSALLQKWMERDWCIFYYGSGCGTYKWGKDDPIRQGLRWRRLDQRLWKGIA